MKAILDFITEDIQTRMTRLGIVANFHIEETTDLRNNTRIKLVSSRFTMTPMIFKEIYVEVNVFVYDNSEYENYKEIRCDVSLCYKTWDNGMNGLNYGSFLYTIENKWFEKDDPRFLNKEGGIEI